MKNMMKNMMRTRKTVRAGMVVAFILTIWGVFTWHTPPAQGQAVAIYRFDDTFRQPWIYTKDVVMSPGVISNEAVLFTVPLGKILVLETAQMSFGKLLQQATLTTTVNLQESTAKLALRTVDEERVFYLDGKTYAGPGKEIRVRVMHPTTPQYGMMFVHLTGYLVDAIPLGQTALRTDVNRDGTTDISDAVALLRRIVGLA